MAFTALSSYRRQILAMVLAMACGSALSEYLLALWIGYPFPFVALTGSPPYLFFMVCCIHVAWGKFLKQHPDAMLKLKSYQNAISVVFILAFTYPAYNYVFVKLSPTQQTRFTLLLPVIKLIAKNAISLSCKYIEDFKPDVVIFNVDIFHAFFVALCMQGSTSVRTVFLLLIMDFVHAGISLWDVCDLVNRIQRLQSTAAAEATILRKS